MLALSSCSLLTTRAPICEPPPIPTSNLQPCPLPEPIPDGKLKTLAEALLEDRNPKGPWAECIRNHDQLIALVRYRDSICQHIADINKQPAKSWYEFWK